MPVRVKPEPQDSNVPHPTLHRSNVDGALSSSQASALSFSKSQHRDNTGISAMPDTGRVPTGTFPEVGQPGKQGSTGDATQKEKEKAPQEDSIDFDSIRGVFGWATVDGINVPYIIRKYRKFVAVRIVEKKILSKYPNSFPDELGKKEPLISYFVTEAEANLLNEINTVHCSFEYGHQPFTTKDLIVDLVEFEEFYNLVKKTFPEDVLATMTGHSNLAGVDDKKVELSKVCGWIQINNTVTPYIIRPAGKFVPLSVIVYAAGLLTKERVEGLSPTSEECGFLNATCQAAGFDFSFGKNTKLIHIAEVVQRCKVRVFELPFDNPLQHAQYLDSLQQSSQSTDQGSDGLLQAPPVRFPGQPNLSSSMTLPYRSMPLSNGPPNMNPFMPMPYNPFASMLNMIYPSPPTSSVPKQNNQTFMHLPQVSQASKLPVHSLSSQLPLSSPASSLQNSSMNCIKPRHMPAPAEGVVQLSTASQGQRPANTFAPQPARLGVHTGLDMCLRPSHVLTSQSGFLPGGQPPPYRPPPPYCPPPAHMVQQSGHHHPPTGLPCNFSTCLLPSNTSPMVEPSSRMLYPGGGPLMRGAVPIVGFPPPSGISGGPGGIQLSTGTIQLPGHPASGTRESPRSTGLSPAADSLSLARHSPVVPAQSNHTIHARDAAVRLSSLTGSPPVSTLVQERSRTSSPQSHLRLVSEITAVLVSGKSISCLVRNFPDRQGKFCLVEAVSKLYFPQCKLPEFVHALQNVLKIDLPLCSEEEAKAFIHFYNLPVTTLNDNHMIHLDDLTKFFPQMSYMFGQPETTKSTTALPITTRRNSGSDSTVLRSPTTPFTVMLTSSDSGEVINIDSDPPTPDLSSPGQELAGAGVKRGALGVLSAPGGKQPCHRLEEMVEKLKQTQPTAPDEKDAPTGLPGKGWDYLDFCVYFLNPLVIFTTFLPH